MTMTPIDAWRAAMFFTTLAVLTSMEAFKAVTDDLMGNQRRG